MVNRAQRDALNKGNRIEAIQILRAFAVILVLIFHAQIISINGFIGVDIFFVISGFVISRKLFLEYEMSKRISLKNFYFERVNRLLPPLICVLIFSLLLSTLILSPNGPQQNAFKTFVGALLYIPNLMMPTVNSDYFNKDISLNPLLHTWSLGIEEQFYLLFPILLLLVLMFSRQQSFKRNFSILLVFVFLLSFFSNFLIPNRLTIPYLAQNAFYSPITRFWELLVGVLTFMISGSRIGRKIFCKNVIKNIMLFCSVLSISIYLLLPLRIATDFRVMVVPVLATSFLLLFSYNTLKFDDSQVRSQDRKIDLHKILVSTGNASYSIYLWHWPLVVLFKTALPQVKGAAFYGVCISLIPAFLSYKFVEGKFARFPSKRKVRVYQLGGLYLVSGMIFSVLYLGMNAGWGLGWPLTAHFGIRNNCDHPPLKLVSCRISPPISNGEIIVVGDSQAWAIADGFIFAAEPRGLGVTVAAYNNCPFVSELERNLDLPCKSWNRDLIGILRNKQYDYVVIANAGTYGNIDRKLYKQLVTQLLDFGLKVVFVLPPPGGDKFSAAKSILVSHGADTRYLPLSDNGYKNIITDVLKSELSKISLVDPSSALCKNELCVVASNGVEIYNDGDHLSRDGALRISPVLKAALK